MDLEQMLRIANSAVFAHNSRRLSEVEAAILLGSMQRQSYESIAQTSGYAVSYLKYDVGPKLWRRLGEALGETVSKTSFQAALEDYWRRSLIATTQTQDMPAAAEPDPLSVNLTSQPAVPVEPTSVATAYTDWGEGVDVSSFYGRSTELATLSQWIVGDRCKLIGLLGMGGIGKTALSVKLAQQLVEGHGESHLPNSSSPFQSVIWRSLRNAPPLETLLAELVPFLSHQQDAQPTLNRLLHHLQSSHCLVILDNLEAILQGGEQAGQFRRGYENYEELLRLVSESNHQSCVLFTSREKPAEVAAFEGIELSVRSLQLGGSEQAAQAILQAKGLAGSNEQKQQLCERYSSSPLALKIVATSIQDLFDGEIGEFLEQDTLIFNGIRRLLDQQFHRLSPLEQSIMYWLAINREWTTIAELHQDIVPATSKANLLEALESLSWRSLIEKQAGSYTQQPVVMEYVTERLIEQITSELQTTELDLFLHYALIKTTVKDYVRQSQVRLILGVIASEFSKAFSSIASLEQQVLRMLTGLRRSETKLSGYGSGNLLNLCNHLQLDLASYSFSGLTVRHAYLQSVNLRRVNFTSTNFDRSVFTQTFGAIYTVDVSSDGNVFAIGDINGGIRLYNFADGQPLLVLKAHTNEVMFVKFSPDSTVLASCSADFTIKLWNVSTGALLRTLAGHLNQIWSIAWSPDGSTLASGSHDQTVKFWDVSTGKVLRTWEELTHQVWCVAWSSSSTTLATSSDRTVKLWNVSTGQLLKVLEGHTDWVRSVVFSPDSTVLASGSHDGTVKLWDVSTGVLLRTLVGHTNQVWSVAWSPDGSTLASGCHDQTVKLWNSSTGQVLRTLQGYSGQIWTIAFSADSRILISGCDDQTVKLWNSSTGQVLRTLQGYSDWVNSVAWSSNSAIIAQGGRDQMVTLRNAYTGQLLNTFHKHHSWVLSVAFSPDDCAIASSGTDQVIQIWEVATGRILQSLRGHTDWIWSVAWSHDGVMLASSSNDQTVKLWNVSTGHLLKTLEGHLGWVTSVVFSLDRNVVATSSADATVKLWDVSTGEVLRTLQDHSDWVWSVKFSPIDSLLATGSADTTVKLWDSSSGKVLRTLQGHTSWVVSVAFSPNGKLLASSSYDLTVRLWDVASGQLLRTLEGHTGSVWSVAWSPNGTTLLSGRKLSALSIQD